MNEELKSALEAMKASLEGKSLEQAKAEIKAFEEKNKELIKTEAKSLFDGEIKAITDDFEAKLKLVQEHADKLDLKMQNNAVVVGQGAGYVSEMTKAITENFTQIKEVRKGNAIQLKVVGDMTLPVNLTGAQPKDYNFDVVMIPGQAVNVADLVGTVNIEGGTYTFPREVAGEGSIATQTEGANKSQRDYDFTMVDVNTDFIAGYTRYSKKMANNLPFLTSFIPKALRRDYFIAENAAFNTVLAAAATASTEVITGQNKVEMLIAEIAKQEALNYTVNAIVVRPADYWDILITEKSAGAGYGLPGIVTLENGQLRINGIPLVRANWPAPNKYYVGDWTRVNKIVTEGLSVEFSEVEGTNFVKNNITARIESQTALAVEQPAAIVYGDFTAV